MSQPFTVGQRVRVTAPFDEAFPDSYVVVFVYEAEGDGGSVWQCALEGIEPHFAAKYLEPA